MTKAGLIQDLPTAGKMFISHYQHPGEKAVNFADELRKLFRRAYPEEELLRRFAVALRDWIASPCESPGVVAREAYDLRTGNYKCDGNRVCVELRETLRN